MSPEAAGKRPETGDAKSDGAANGQNSKGTQTIDPAWEAALARHQHYCDMLGITTQEPKQKTRQEPKQKIKPETKPETKWLWWRFLGSSRTVHGKPGSYYKMILNAYDNHSWQYWFIASLVNTLYLVQIVLGATATALSATKTVSSPAVTALTATSTIVAGILAFLKGRGQPNRVRQLRNDLGLACDEAHLWDMELKDPECKTTALEAVENVRRKYQDARANARTNLPDTWATASTTRENIERDGKGDLPPNPRSATTGREAPAGTDPTAQTSQPGQSTNSGA
jgi:hypothetical protein